MADRSVNLSFEDCCLLERPREPIQGQAFTIFFRNPLGTLAVLLSSVSMTFVAGLSTTGSLTLAKRLASTMAEILTQVGVERTTDAIDCSKMQGFRDAVRRSRSPLTY